MVGYASRVPHENVVILTGDRLNKTRVLPQESYEKFAVGEYAWDGICGSSVLVSYPKGAERSEINRTAETLIERLG
jgi:hypothetical protein